MRALSRFFVAAVLCLAWLAAPAHATDAVVLVSGFTTSTPFSTSAAGCAGKEGSTWSPNVAPTLKKTGLTVFTAPEGEAAKAPTPCVGAGQAAPDPSTTTIDTGGDADTNGKALAAFLAFLRDQYGVTTVQLVGHSDGGIWSRAALTQSGAYGNGLTVQSLTTLGTPHTGAFTADLLEAMNGATCDFADEIEQDICDAFEDVLDVLSKQMGPTALKELTNTYMASWNPQQRIGSCAVTTVAGDHVNIPLIGWLLPSYYNRSDGLVGVASALAEGSTTLELTPIVPPAFATHVNGGTFDVVHSETLSFLSPNNLLNQDDITAVVLSAVRAGAAAGVPCNGTGAGLTVRGPERLAVPLRSAALVGRSTRAQRGDLLVARSSVKASCGGRTLAGGGTRGVQVLPLAECRGRLAVKGGDALLLRSDPERRVSLRLSGSSLSVTVSGRSASGAPRVQRRSGSRWRSLKLDSKGRARLPTGDAVTKVRVLVRPARGAKLEWATATLDR
jgi:triacylglycerol lipase